MSSESTTIYVAKYGDYLVKIAEEHGTTWQAIWNHPLNAEHQRKRNYNPDKLEIGDVLHIPVAPGPPSLPPLDALDRLGKRLRDVGIRRLIFHTCKALTPKHRKYWLVHKLSRAFHPKKAPPRHGP